MREPLSDLDLRLDDPGDARPLEFRGMALGLLAMLAAGFAVFLAVGVR